MRRVPPPAILLLRQLLNTTPYRGAVRVSLRDATTAVIIATTSLTGSGDGRPSSPAQSPTQMPFRTKMWNKNDTARHSCNEQGSAHLYLAVVRQCRVPTRPLRPPDHTLTHTHTFHPTRPKLNRHSCDGCHPNSTTCHDAIQYTEYVTQAPLPYR